MEGDALPEIVVAPPGPRSRELAARLAAVESPAFDARRAARADASGEGQGAIVYANGSGSNVFDADGNRYVDLTAGFGALILGHPPNASSRAHAEESDRLTLALGDVYASEAKVRACEALAKLLPEDGARVMLGLSGADAVTCALKTAVLATGKPGVVAFEGSYHGLSHGPLALLGFAPSFREPFAAQLNPNVTFAPYPHGDDATSLSAVRAALAKGNVGAVLVEPILGRGGCVVPPSSFLPALRALADEHGALLVVDEIWSGIARSGAMLALDHTAVLPDVICLGKGLGGGAPISACVGRGRVMAAWGAHGGATIHTGTHFGSPPACAAALATLETVRKESLAERAADLGEVFREALANACGARARVRGRGLMIGVELADAAEALAVTSRLLARGWIVLTGGANGATLTLSPPLVIAPELLGAFASALGEALQ